MIDTVLIGVRVRLRPVRGEADAAALAIVFSDPTVARWWGDPAARLREALDPEPHQSCFAVEVGGEVAGFVQCFEEPDPDYRHASLDIAMRSAWQGGGYGREALWVLLRHLVDVRGHHRATIDPAAANRRAIRAYARVGFRPVGVMRRYERTGDVDWHDGLLMDLLAEELPAEPPV